MPAAQRCRKKIEVVDRYRRETHDRAVATLAIRGVAAFERRRAPGNPRECRARGITDVEAPSIDRILPLTPPREVSAGLIGDVPAARGEAVGERERHAGVVGPFARPEAVRASTAVSGDWRECAGCLNSTAAPSASPTATGKERAGAPFVAARRSAGIGDRGHVGRRRGGRSAPRRTRSACPPSITFRAAASSADADRSDLEPGRTSRTRRPFGELSPDRHSSSAASASGEPSSGPAGDAKQSPRRRPADKILTLKS